MNYIPRPYPWPNGALHFGYGDEPLQFSTLDFILSRGGQVCELRDPAPGLRIARQFIRNVISEAIMQEDGQHRPMGDDTFYFTSVPVLILELILQFHLLYRYRAEFRVRFHDSYEEENEQNLPSDVAHADFILPVHSDYDSDDARVSFDDDSTANQELFNGFRLALAPRMKWVWRFDLLVRIVDEMSLFFRPRIPAWHLITCFSIKEVDLIWSEEEIEGRYEAVFEDDSKSLLVAAEPDRQVPPFDGFVPIKIRSLTATIRREYLRR